ncbi:TPA: hypothetical protein EYP12_03545 [Candidatus Bipolaricaulota bacterium]|nr:hypothetical protein [Candidatus Bipolaricaulota bacterium]
MGFINPYLVQRLAEERVKDALREVEQARLIRAVQGPWKAQKEWFNVIGAILSGLASSVVGR